MNNHYSKSNFNQLINISSLIILKIKFAINFLNKKYTTKNNTSTNINHYFILQLKIIIIRKNQVKILQIIMKIYLIKTYLMKKILL